MKPNAQQPDDAALGLEILPGLTTVSIDKVSIGREVIDSLFNIVFMFGTRRRFCMYERILKGHLESQMYESSAKGKETVKSIEVYLERW